MSQSNVLPTRRRFLAESALFLTASGVATSLRADERSALGKPSLRIGLMTDVHYADRETAGTRCYRESISKMREAVGALKKRKVALALELGDFTDEAPEVAVKIGYVKKIDAEFRKVGAECRHVLGNHCVDNLTKEELLAAVDEQKTYYSFDRGGFHFIVLDACFRSDGQPYCRGNFDWTDANISKDELKWLAADLDATDLPTVAAVHQRLDCGGHMGINNAHLVRDLFENSKKVRVVFQGHHHKNDYNRIGGIHYCTLRSVVDGPYPDSSAYAAVDLFKNGDVVIEGFRKQDAYRWG